MTHKEGHGSVKVIKHGPPGVVLFLTYIGAAIYFVSRADSFGEGLLGLLQAAVWPVYVIYHVLQLLGA